MRGARLVLAVSLLVGWTATAAAECAWVLWVALHEKVGTVDGTTWILGEAYNDQVACNADRPRQWEKVLIIARSQSRPESRLLKVPGRSVTINYPASDIMPAWSKTYTLHCLPDTIDPREKKE